MAVSLNDYLKNNKTVQAAQKKLAAAQSALVQIQKAQAGTPASAGAATLSSVNSRVAAAQEALTLATEDFNNAKQTATAYYNTNVDVIQKRQDSRTTATDKNRLSDAYAMRQRLIDNNQPTTAIDSSIKDLNDKINKVGKYAPKKVGAGTPDGAGPGTPEVVFRDYAKELSTVGQAIAQMSESQREALSKSLKAANYKVPISGAYSEQLKNAYTQAIADNQIRSLDFNREIPIVEFLALKATEPSTGTGAPQAFATISPATVAAGLINDAYQRNLNRDATPAEISSITKKLNAAEKKNPSKQVNGITTGGLDRNQFLDEIVKSRPEFAKRKEDKKALTTETLMSVAKSNGLTPSSLQLDEWNRRIQNGEDINIIKKNIRDTASLGLPDNIKKMMADGTDLETIYAPYKNLMYQVLEINPESIDLNDSTLRSAIGINGEMPIYEFQRKLRKDPRWQYTNNAREEVSSVALKVLRDFGFQG
jgi:hypothetical protein